MSVTASFAQLLVIDGKVIHGLTPSEADSIIALKYDFEACSELLSVCDSAIVEYQGLVTDMSQKISLLDLKFSESERLSQMAVKQYKKEFRRHKLTKVGLVISVTALMVVALR